MKPAGPVMGNIPYILGISLRVYGNPVSHATRFVQAGKGVLIEQLARASRAWIRHVFWRRAKLEVAAQTCLAGASQAVLKQELLRLPGPRCRRTHPARLRRIFLLVALGLSLCRIGIAAERAEEVLGRIPVQDGGRTKPFASFARESVLLVTGKTSFEGQDSTSLVWRWMAEPKMWSAKPILPVTDLKLRDEFSASDLVHNRIAPNLILNDLDFVKRANLARLKQEKEKTSTPLEKKEVELYQRAQLFQAIATAQIPGFIPHPEDPKIAWLPLEAFMTKEGVEIISQIFPKSQVEKVEAALGYLLGRFKGSNSGEAVLAGEQFANSVDELLFSKDIMLDRGSIQRELLYLKLRPFHLAWILYLISLFIWMAPHKKKKVVACALGFFLAGFLVHALGILLRVLIAGRPPVTNMYESLIWVSWAVAFFSLLLWFFYRSSFLPAIAACVSTFALLIGESFPAVLDPSISPLVPVLRNNYWLTVHVLTITLGYGAFALNWGIAHALLYCLAFNRKKELTNHLTEYLYRSLQIGVVLLASGTILGGVWASYSWGRFWGWDPKETWALIAVLAYLAVLHSRTAGWFESFGAAFWSAACFLTVLMAWYGVNFVLGVGLHSYGFGGGGLPYVLAFVIADLILLLFFARRFKMKT